MTNNLPVRSEKNFSSKDASIIRFGSKVSAGTAGAGPAAAVKSWDVELEKRQRKSAK